MTRKLRNIIWVMNALLSNNKKLGLPQRQSKSVPAKHYLFAVLSVRIKII